MSFQRILILVLISVVALGGAAYLTSRILAVSSEIGSEEQSGPLGLKIEPRILDLGTLMVNREIHFTAQIRNYGEEPIKIERLEKSCGCTSVSVAQDTCQPGEEVELKGTLNPRKPGKFRHLVKIIEDEKRGQEHILEVVGQAQASISIFPESALLNPSVFENKAVEQVIVFKNNSNERVAVRQPVSMPEGVSVRLPKDKIGPKQETKAVVRVEPRFFVDTDVSLLFPTSHSTQDIVTLALQLRPKNGFAVVPNKIRLGVVSKKDLERTPIRLSLIGAGVKNVSVDRVVAPPFLKLSREITRRGDRLEMEFSFAKLEGMSMQGAIRIQLDVMGQGQKDQQTVAVNVPVSGILRE